MKRSLVASLVAVGVLTTGIAIASGPDTVSFHLGKNVFVAGNDITVTEPVAGDLYIAGRSVRVESAVAGDLMFGAMSMTVDGDVAGSVRGGAQTVAINGSVGKTVVVGATEAGLNEGTKATVGDVMIGAQSTFIARPVSGDLAVGAGTLQINKSVAGSATFQVGSLGADDAATIAGDVTYYSQAVGDPIQQRLEQLAPTRVTHKMTSYNTETTQVTTAMRVAMLLVMVSSIILVGWLAQVAARGAMEGLVTVQRKQYVLTLLMGIVFVPVVMVVLFILARLMIFAPVAIALAMAMPLLVMVGVAATYQNIGDMVRRGKMDRPAASVLAGGIVVLALSLIPFLGGILMFVLMLLAMGSLVMYMLQATGLVKAGK